MKRLCFTGDMLCYPSMTNAYTNGGSIDYSPILCDAIQELSSADFKIGNLETPVAGERLGFTNERYRFNSPCEYLTMLKKAGFDLLCAANNHCMDRDEEGIPQTLENCRREGLDCIGIYASAEEREKVYVKSIGSARVAFVNYTYGTNAFHHHLFLKHDYMVNLFQPEETLEGAINLLASSEEIEKRTNELYFTRNAVFDECIAPHLKRLKDDIKRAKEVSDIVVAVMHSGGQYNPVPDAYTRQLAAKIKDYGADVIVGHHPHILQTCDFADGFLTVFSLGNFIFTPSDTGEKAVDPSYSALLYLDIDDTAEKPRISGASFSLMKVLEAEYGKIRCVNTADLEKSIGKDEILHYAEIFSGKRYNECSREYKLVF